MRRSPYAILADLRQSHFDRLSQIFIILFSISFLTFIARIGFDIPELIQNFSGVINTFLLIYTSIMFIWQLILWRVLKKSLRLFISNLIFTVFIIVFVVLIFQDNAINPNLNQSAYVVTQFILFLCLFSDSYNVQRKVLSIPLTPFQLLSVSFLSVILIGTLFLMLPNSTYHSISFLDALFTATSATCVTGLVVFDTGTMFTLTGQTIILILIQIGGIGIITITAFFTMMGGEKASLKDALIAKEISQSKSISHIPGFLFRIVTITFSFELIAAVFLMYWWDTEFFTAFFHSVSAFCNAGFSLFPNSFMTTHNDFLSLFVISMLVIIGGIGIFVITDLGRVFFNRVREKRFRLTNQSHIVLKSYGLLLGIGFLFFLVEGILSNSSSDWNHIITDSFFQTAMLRTAGFNSIPISNLSMSLCFWVILFMFIGGGSGSTAGGIKVNTVAVLLLKIKSLLKGEQSCTYRNRTINNSMFNQAILVFVLSFIFIGITTLLLVMTQDQNPIDLIFESVSAFATVGLSRGVTADLNAFGKTIIIISMFAGRIGIVSFALSLVNDQQKQIQIKYPNEEIQIG
jgi:trk system potassium uptake protein TrkH